MIQALFYLIRHHGFCVLRVHRVGKTLEFGVLLTKSYKQSSSKPTIEHRRSLEAKYMKVIRVVTSHHTQFSYVEVQEPALNFWIIVV